MNSLSAQLETSGSWRVVTTADKDLRLMVPEADVDDPEVSIVIPALNEAITIGPFLDWCQEGLRRAGVHGEVLIIDSSTDATAEIALAKGARVLKSPKRGLGRAYIDALPFIRGKYVIMGDADCTYDFRKIEPFIESFRSGHEYVMGSRFKGFIEPGAMPTLHRYFGTPLTTWLLNFLYGSHFSDIHCGMRGITLAALRRMDLHSQSWEYASEMVLKSVRMNLRIDQVPVRFLKDQEGRLSHHKRSGWLSPWLAGWINVKAMFIHGADFFLFRPGLLLLCTGLLLTLPMALGPRTLGPITFSLNSMFLGVTLAVLGLHGLYMGLLTRILFDYDGSLTQGVLRAFSYTRSVIVSFALALTGCLMTVPLIRRYWDAGYRLSTSELSLNHLAVAGLLLVIIGAMNFTFTLAVHAVAAYVRRR